MSDTATSTCASRFATARAVADAVLYEGYVLYPYRASSRKNQVRFQWGVLTPKAFSDADGSERWHTRTECLVDPRPDPGHAALHVRVRCLQTQRRRIEVAQPIAGLKGPPQGAAAEASFAPADALEIDGTCHVEWDEAVDRIVDLGPLPLDGTGTGTSATQWGRAFTLDGGTETELVHGADGTLAGRFVRERLPVDGAMRVATEPATDGSPYVKVSVTVENTTDWSDPARDRNDAMARSLVAVHTMVAADGAAFVSLLDPPDDALEAARACRSDGSYPVVVGDETVVLSSPIILYDHPEVAQQSPGDLYDALEIDEILALRVMTLTEAEKSEARGTDQRAAAIIDRCDSLSPAALGRLHGEMRPVGATVGPEWELAAAPASEPSPAAAHSGGDLPWWDPAADAAVDPWTDTVTIAGAELGPGSRVRLHPSGRSDAQDMFLSGLCGTVAGVFADVDGGCHLAVSLDDDPAGDELTWQGRYRYFHPDELEPLDDRSQAR